MTLTEEKARALSGADRDVSLVAIDQYLREVKWTSPMSEQEEQALFSCITHSKHEPENVALALLASSARDRLVEAFQETLVLPAAKKMLRVARSLELLDLVNEANIVLLSLIDRYAQQGDYTGRFAPLAFVELGHGLYSVLCKTDDLVRVPPRIQGLLRHKRRVEQELVEGLGRRPSWVEIAAEMGISQGRVRDLEEVERLRRPASLQGLVEEDDAEDRHNFVGLFASQVARDDVASTAMREAFEQAFPSLTEREREVVSLHYGVGDAPSAHTVTEIAEYRGASVCSIASLKSRAVERLRDVLEPKTVNGVTVCAVQGAYADYYTTEEAANVLGISAVALHARAYRGRLPFERRSGSAHELFFSKSIIDDLVAAAAAADEQECYTVEEAAWYLGVTPASLYRYVQQGRIESIRRTVSHSTHSSVLFFPKLAVHTFAAARRVRRSALLPSVVA